MHEKIATILYSKPYFPRETLVLSIFLPSFKKRPPPIPPTIYSQSLSFLKWVSYVQIFIHHHTKKGCNDTRFNASGQFRGSFFF